MKAKSFAVAGLVVLMTLVLVGGVMAQGEPPAGDGSAPVGLPGLRDLILLLGTAAGGGVVAAFLAEKQAWFQRLPSDIKGIVFPVLIIGVPVIARLLMQFIPADAWPVIEAYWAPIAGGLIACGFGTATYHAIIKPQQLAAKQLQRVMARPVVTPPQVIIPQGDKK